MYSTVQFIHSYWAYLVLAVMVITTINSLIGYFSDREFAPKDFRLALFTLICTHIQLLIGIVLYFVSPYTIDAISEVGMSEVMSNDTLRLYVIEHPLMMIITITLVTIGYSKQKKKLTSRPKFKILSIFYTLALLCLLSRIPWSAWF